MSEAENQLHDIDQAHRIASVSALELDRAVKEACAVAALQEPPCGVRVMNYWVAGYADVIVDRNVPAYEIWTLAADGPAETIQVDLGLGLPKVHPQEGTK